MPPLLIAAAILVDDEEVGAYLGHVGLEIEHPAARGDAGMVDVADGPDHVEPFPLVELRDPALQVPDVLVRADAHMEVAVLGGRLEEADVPGVQEVVAATDEHFGFGTRILLHPSPFRAGAVVTVAANTIQRKADSFPEMVFTFLLFSASIASAAWIEFDSFLVTVHGPAGDWSIFRPRCVVLGERRWPKTWTCPKAPG